MFVVAVVTVAAATAGPIYDAAARTSILHDTVGSADVLGQGYEVVQAGALSMGLGPVSAEVAADLGRTARVFRSPVQALEGTAYDAATQEDLGLVWRTGVCGHLRISGRCPSAVGEVIVSRSVASLNGWHTGQRVVFPTWGSLEVTGVYAAPPAADNYWFDRIGTYFPTEYPAGTGTSTPGPEYDAMFTARATLLGAPAATQGTAVMDATVDNGALRPGDVGALTAAATTLVNDPQLSEVEAVVTSDIPATMAKVRTGWSSLAIPVLLITLELLGLAWLLLFLLVTEAVAARGPEVALAKLRGQGRWRTAAFGLSEPVLLLAVALPVGAGVGWAAMVLLGHALLRPGTPVGFPAVGWAAAGAATAGGLAAVIGASLGTLRRAVIEQWRRPARRAADRGWVSDAILVTGAAAGLAELAASGQVTSAHHDALSLLVPGLVGVAVAVVASRLLPPACSVIGRSGRSGVAAFLALRHVARRPGASRTTVMLATSFALATFAVSAWAVGHTNYRRVAAAQVGAPTVLTVSVPPGRDPRRSGRHSRSQRASRHPGRGVRR